jgi:hypothetical protein
LSTLRPALGETSCDLEILRIFFEETYKAFGRLDNPLNFNQIYEQSVQSIIGPIESLKLVGRDSRPR